MGRLFWRFFWFFWLAQVTTTLTVGGSVWLLYRLTSAPMPALLQPPQHPPSLFPLLMPMLVGGVVSLVFAGLMAAYVTRPIRRLDQAFKAIAAGQLDERIGGVLGAPDNELTALGPGFDHMAGRLQALVESHRRLLHDVSHEMRAPLARLQAAAELMGKSPQRIAELSERQQRDIDRMNDLVGELLTLARLETASHVGDPTDLTLLELLQGVAQDARFDAGAKDCVITLECDPAIAIRGKPELLHRAIDNIVCNAVKHAPDGSAVDIKASLRSGQAQIDILDNGGGVAADELDRIFEPFTRGRNAVGAGHGLGLAIARRAIQAHGGQISAANTAGGGLCVSIRLPDCTGQAQPLSHLPLGSL